MNAVQVKRVVETVKEFPGLGLRIGEAIKEDGRTFKAIAEACDLSRQYLYQLVAEQVSVPVTEVAIRKIEQGLDIDLGVKFE